MKSRGMAFCTFVATLALSGCVVGPDYDPPAISAPDRFAYCDPCGAAEQAALDEEALAVWWEQFEDPQLNALVTEALSTNPGLVLARSRVREARYRLAGARAALLPTLGVLATANHTRLSQNSGLSSLVDAFGGGAGGGSGAGTSSGIALPGESVSTFTAGFDAIWELDLFGGGRRTTQAAAAGFEAQVWSLRDAQVSLIAELAHAYFGLREIQSRRELVDDLIAVRGRTLSIVEAKAKSGIVPSNALTAPTLAVEQAVAARSQLADAERSTRVAIATLLGKPVGEFEMGRRSIADSTGYGLIEIPSGLPSDLLRRRPDLRAAERRLAAATAQIGVAEAARLPSFSLTGIAELVSTSLTSLLSDRSIQTVAQGQLSAPLIDFGRGAAATGVAREQAEQAELAYRQQFLGALADVETALSSITGNDEQTAALSRVVASLEAKKRAAVAGYESGITDYTPVAQSFEALLLARQQLLTANLSSRRARIALFKALGGGWRVE